jgi:capsular polysaccharide export protein
MLASNSQQGSPIQRRNSILAEEGPVVAFHMKAWKHPFLQQFFPQKRFHFMPFQLSEKQFRRKVLPLLQGRQKPVIFVWSNNCPSTL